MKADQVEPFLDSLTRWASAQPDIMAAALVGSYARDAATDTSDVDVVLIARHPAKLLHDHDWIEQFGQVRRRQVEDYGLLTSVRVWYVAGCEIEFGIAGQQWAALPLDEGTRRVIRDGMRILFEHELYLTAAINEAAGST